MTEKTQEFLTECKEAGYEKVTIFIHDKRLPLSCERRKANTGRDPDDDGMYENSFGEKLFATKDGNLGVWWGTAGGTRANPDGSPPFGKVVCAEPARRSQIPDHKEGKTWPAIWGIVRRIGLNSGGAGHSDAIDVNRSATHLLTPGYYDLSELN